MTHLVHIAHKNGKSQSRLLHNFRDLGCTGTVFDKVANIESHGTESVKYVQHFA